MMQFNIIDETTVVATNSIKEVSIVRKTDVDDYDRNSWMLYTPNGGLSDNITIRGPYTSFNAAKKVAEADVGISLDLEEFY